MSSAALRTLAAVSRSRGPRPPWPTRPAAAISRLHTPMPPWPSPHTLPYGPLRSFSTTSLHHAGKNTNDSHSTPTSRLAFADMDANEQPMDHAEVLDPLRPPQGKHLTKAEYQQLLKRINVMMTKVDLVVYLKRHASDTHSNLSAYLPMGTYLSPKTTLTKSKLVRALVHGVWGVPEPGATSSSPSSSSSSSSSSTSADGGESDDPVMARVRAIPDHVSGTLEIPCTPRDLFFVHGHGETVRSLMLQGGVVIQLDTNDHKIVVKGTGAGIKKTVGQIRALLQYRESEMQVPISTQTSFRTLTLATKFIKRIMRQCNVYMEERTPPTAAAASPSTSPTTPAPPSMLHITATSLVSLAAAKQLVRNVWDIVLDSRWHAVSATAVSSTKSMTDHAYAMVPFAEPHWTDSKVLDGVARWTIAPIRELEGKIGDSPTTAPAPAASTSMLTVPLVVPSAPSVPSPPPLSPSTSSPLALHHHTLSHYLSHLPATLPVHSSLELATMRGNLSLFTADDITDDTPTATASGSLFSAPLAGGLSLDDLAGFARVNLPRWTFQPSAPAFSAANASDPIVEWRRTPKEDAAEQEYNLEVAARDKQAAKLRRKMAKNGMPVLTMGANVPEPTEVAGAPVRRWRIVYSADMEHQQQGTRAWPGRRDLVVDVAMPLFSEALPPPAASNGDASTGGSSSRIIVGGDLKMDRLETRQVAVTVDTMDLDRSQAIRTDVTLVQPARPAFADFFKSVVLPTTVRSENRLFAPPSFVYEGKEYTCKWIGRIARAQSDRLEHVYAQSNDGNEDVVTRVVRRYAKGGPKDWVKEEDKGKGQVRQSLGLGEDDHVLAS